MLLERAELLAKEGAEAEMLTVMTGQGVPLLAAVPGVTSVRFGRGVENPDRFLLLVEWIDMNAHTAFTQAPAFAEFRALIMPVSRGGAMEHFEMDEPATA
jgi:heme-degrading monooxygenase HmoA